MCLDFRKLNAVTKKDAYSLLYLMEILEKWPDARYFSTVDMSKANHQVMLKKSNCQYTGFVVPGRGLF